MITTTETQLAAGFDSSCARPLNAEDFLFEVDGVTYQSKRRKLTGAEIMAVAKIPPSDGLIQLFPDGTTATIAPAEEVDLEPDVKFKRRPRFKRG
ncbi:MAG: multiubiquitin domain-containing protein [Caldilineaceae bacterium]|nr:multiubiquitin domain-containing protein [Caldilineaceae bacterium]